MMRAYVKTALVIGAAVAVCGFSLPECGLTRSDFAQVNVDGFDAVDNAVDANNYAWSMEFFQADNANTGYLYVGTGNGIADLAGYNIEVNLGLEDAGQEPIRPPEIRRYRPDLGPKTWETVFDYRDVETDPDFETIGFRMMTTYRAQSDGVKYLYAAAMSKTPRLWRSATGEPGSWEMVWSLPDSGSVRWMAEHNGILYLAPALDVPFEAELAQIWATDGATFWPVVQDGFGNPNNLNVACLTSFNGWLYAGTKNQQTGYEVWKLLGPGADKQAPVQVVKNGGPCVRNDIAGTPCVFQGNLYMGSLLFVGGMNYETVNLFKGCDIIRICPDDSWQSIVGPCGLSGYDSGFNDFMNDYCWQICEHDGWLYASTYDGATMYSNFPEGLIYLAAFKLFGVQLDFKRETMDRQFRLMRMHAGADLFKSPDGIHWYPVTIDGFGDMGNYGFRTMKSVGDTLYVGTANPFTGVEVWAGQKAVHY